ncbi:MAG TPA: hypothetical protein VIV15_05560 [Anaerolineales bacterium]
MTLPGVPVSFWQVHPKLRRLGYSIRESVDGDVVYLVCGADDLVATISSDVATVRLLDSIIQSDIAERAKAKEEVAQLEALL